VRNPLDSVTSLFRSNRWRFTLLLWAAFVSSAVPMFFSLSWLPSLAHLAHIDASTAAIGPSIFAVSGLLFAILIARVIDRIGSLFLVVAVTTALGAPAFVLLGQSFGNDHAFLLACGLAGALSVSSVNLMGVVAGMLYEDNLRSRGIGWAVAAMRLGAALAPWLGGFLIARALPVQMMFIGLALSPLISGLAVLALWQMARRRGLKVS
jgi:MFS family permease